MAEIVVLKKWRDTHPQRAQGRPLQRQETRPQGDLVLFLGVRYERLDEMSHRTMDEMALRLDTN